MSKGLWHLPKPCCMGERHRQGYSAAKGGIASMTYTWALEFPSRGIRANCLAPVAQTRMSAYIPGHTAEGPAPKLAAPGPVFLASDEADWVHGQVFHLAGEAAPSWSSPSTATP